MAAGKCDRALTALGVSIQTIRKLVWAGADERDKEEAAYIIYKFDEFRDVLKKKVSLHCQETRRK
jgi:hypothetical protein